MPISGQARTRAGMFAGRPANPPRASFWSQALQQARAAGEGALDAATFGLDDQLAAGVHAAGDWMQGKSLARAYAQRIAEQHARDAYDKLHYGAARTVGTVATLFVPGTGLGSAVRVVGKLPQAARVGAKVAAMAGKLGRPAAKVAKRIPQVTKISGKEKAGVAVAGAVSGAAGQGITDLAQGRLSSLQDYLGAALGGSAEGLAALRGNPKLAAAIGGATGSAAQDIANGRLPSLEEAAKSAYTSSALAGVAGAAATRKAARATIKQKEKMGEMGSHLRTLLNFDITTSTAKKPVPLDVEKQIPVKGKLKKEPYTQPDQQTARGKLVEAKFGVWARLTPRQRQALKELESRYRVDHFLPQDVGSLAGFAISQPTHAASRQEDWQLNPAIAPMLQPELGIPLFAPDFPTMGRESPARRGR